MQARVVAGPVDITRVESQRNEAFEQPMGEVLVSKETFQRRDTNVPQSADRRVPENAPDDMLVAVVDCTPGDVNAREVTG